MLSGFETDDDTTSCNDYDEFILEFPYSESPGNTDFFVYYLGAFLLLLFCGLVQGWMIMPKTKKTKMSKKVKTELMTISLAESDPSSLYSLASLEFGEILNSKVNSERVKSSSNLKKGESEEVQSFCTVSQEQNNVSEDIYNMLPGVFQNYVSEKSSNEQYSYRTSF